MTSKVKDKLVRLVPTGGVLMLKNIEYTSDKIFFSFKRTCDKEFSLLNEQSVILNIHNIKRDSRFTLDWESMPGTVKVNTK